MAEPQTPARPEGARHAITAGDLYVAASSIHGRGVFAARRFHAGEVVERCPVVVCPRSQAKFLAQTEMAGRCYGWKDGQAAVALGFGSLYNHAQDRNANYEVDFELDALTIVAARTIDAAEEITIHYGPAGRRLVERQPTLPAMRAAALTPLLKAD